MSLVAPIYEPTSVCAVNVSREICLTTTVRGHDQNCCDGARRLESPSPLSDSRRIALRILTGNRSDVRIELA